MAKLNCIKVIVHAKFFLYGRGGLRVCGHFISCSFSQREIGACRQIWCDEYMAKILVNYIIGSGILAPPKTERNLIAGEDSYFVEHTLYIRGDGVLVLTESQKVQKLNPDPPMRTYLKMGRET